MISHSSTFPLTGLSLSSSPSVLPTPTRNHPTSAKLRRRTDVCEALHRCLVDRAFQPRFQSCANKSRRRYIEQSCFSSCIPSNNTATTTCRTTDKSRVAPRPKTKRSSPQLPPTTTPRFASSTPAPKQRCVYARPPLHSLANTAPHPQAGLNLNIFAALSGSMFSRSKKTTDTRPDGSSRSVETTDTAAQAQGRGAANMQAVAEARSDAGKRYAKGQEAIENSGDAGPTKKRIEEAKTTKKKQKQVQAQQMDHLGIEGRW
ncbi:hypothetical protein BC567DRAFT_219433 [Phyllosticta citribraziliensis]